MHCALPLRGGVIVDGCLGGQELPPVMVLMEPKDTEETRDTLLSDQ